MSAGTVLAIAIPILVILAAAVAFTSARRRDAGRLGQLSRETRSRDRVSVSHAAAGTSAGREVEKAAVLQRIGGDLEPVVEAAPPAKWTPPDPETLGVTRRQVLNRSAITLMLLSISGFGAASLAFLWPQVKGGFGAKVKVGTRADVDAAIAGSQPAPNFAYFVEAQAYIQPYPADALEAAAAVYPENILAGMREGYVALWQKCPHLGCKVPACASSQWFECPCHGSQYNRVGEKKAGPAPRGMDHFPIIFEGENVIIDTGTVVLGPVIGTNTTDQGLEGPHCTSGGHG